MDRKQQLQQLLANTTALLEAMHYSVHSASDDFWKYGSYKTFLRKYMALATEAGPFLKDTTLLDAFDLQKVKGNCDTLALEQKEMFDMAYSNAALLKSMLEGEIGYAEDEAHKLADFIQSNLRKTVFGTPEREVEIQNSIEALIVGRGMAKGLDYDRETGRVKTSGKECVPDFVFPRLRLCLEVKLAKTAEKLKSIVDEINADIRMYSSGYDRQFYIVYDLGTIRDEAEFKRDLETASGVMVIMVKH